MNNRDERKANKHRFLTAITISVFLHVLLVAGSIYLQYLTGMRRPQLKAIDVSLVSLPGPGSSDEVDLSGGQLSVPEPEPEPEFEPVVEEPQVEPDTQKKPEPVKDIPKKVPDKPKKVEPKKVKEKPKEPEKKVRQTKTNDFERTLEKLRQKVQQGPPSNLYKRSGPGRFSSGDGDYGVPMGPYERYLVNVVTIIRQNWSFTPQFIKEKGDIKAYVALTINPTGAITDIMLDRGSISSYFNDTVIKAIETSSPLPPIPENVSYEPVRLGLVFTPQGIE